VKLKAHTPNDHRLVIVAREMFGMERRLSIYCMFRMHWDPRHPHYPGNGNHPGPREELNVPTIRSVAASDTDIISSQTTPSDQTGTDSDAPFQM